MNKIIYNVLEKLEKNGYEAYLVGGYVREKLLGGSEVLDIDITTNARPKDVVKIFSGFDVKLYEYGNVSFDIDNFKFDITTFRKDIKYLKNRKPESIIYIDSLEEDIKRRDFTINAICLDKDGNYIDYFNGKKDLKKKTIRSVGDPHIKLKEDALRILRAIRFATIYRFKLDSELKSAIKENREYLRELSYERKKDELNKIFCSKYKKYGVKLLKELELLDVLELKNIDNVLLNNDLIGMWATITDADYAFTKKEKELIKKINDLLDEDINDPFVQYKYGQYPINIVSNLKKLNTKKIISHYDRLPIKDRNEIKINCDKICEVLGVSPGNFLKEIMNDLEKKILFGEVLNNEDALICYIKNTY